MKKSWVLCYQLSTKQRLWSDWVDAQADVSLRWMHRSFYWFCYVQAHIFLICTIGWVHFNVIENSLLQELREKGHKMSVFQGKIEFGQGKVREFSLASMLATEAVILVAFHFLKKNIVEFCDHGERKAELMSTSTSPNNVLCLLAFVWCRWRISMTLRAGVPPTDWHCS